MKSLRFALLQYKCALAPSSIVKYWYYRREAYKLSADSKFAPSQWETSLYRNDVSH